MPSKPLGVCALLLSGVLGKNLPSREVRIRPVRFCHSPGSQARDRGKVPQIPRWPNEVGFPVVEEATRSGFKRMETGIGVSLLAPLREQV